MTKPIRVAVAALCLLGGACAATAAPVIYMVGSTEAAGIQFTLDAYRAQLGALNPNVAGSFAGGRREINWDGVPDAFAGPKLLPANFFNANSPRGVEFKTPGSGFQVSANAGSGAVEFGHINPNYSSLFAPFSAQRLFTAIDSNIVDVHFFVPGTSTQALTSGFGAIFSDVDLAATTSIEYFDQFDMSLGLYFAPSVGGNETFSFLGAWFDEGPVVARVRITNGNQLLGPNNTASDLVVMDDFIFGEPMARVAVPEPATGALVALALLATLGLRRHRHPVSRSA